MSEIFDDIDDRFGATHDFNTDVRDYSQIKTPVTPYEVDPLGEKLKEGRKRESTIEAAELGDKAKAVGSAFMEQNFMGQGFRALDKHLNDSKYISDDVFLEGWNEEAVTATLRNNKLDVNTYFSRMSEAKSEAHRESIVDELRETQANTKFVYDNISDEAKVASTVTGAILDIDTLLVGPVAGVLGKGAKMSKVFKATVGVETAGAFAKSQMSEDYDIFKDGLLDVTVGTFVDVSLFKLVGGGSRFKNTLRDVRKDSVTNKESIDSMFKGYGLTVNEQMARNADAKTFEMPPIKLESEKAFDFRTKEVENIQAELAELLVEKKYTKGKNKGKVKPVSKKKQKELEQRIIEIEDIREREVSDLRWEEKKAARREEELEAQRFEDENTSWLEKNKQKQRDEAARRAKEKETAELEQRAEDYRTKLDTKHKTEMERERQKHLDDLAERKKKQDTEAKERAEERKIREERREYYTKQFSKGKYTPEAIARSAFYRLQDEAKIAAAKLEDTKQAREAIDRINRFEDMIDGMSGTVQEVLSRIGRRMSGGNIDYEDIPEILEIVAKKFPEEERLVRNVVKYITDHRMNDIDTEEILDRIMKTKFKGLSPLQKVGAVSLLIGTPNFLFAGEGETTTEDYIGYGIALGLLAIIAGPSVINRIKNKNVKDGVKELFNSMGDASRIAAYQTGEGKGVVKMIGDTQKRISTGFNSTFKGLASLAYKIGNPEKRKEAMDIIDGLFLNPLNGKIGSADVEKTSMVRGVVAEVHNEMKVGLKKFIDNKGLSKSDKFAKHDDLEREFNNMIAGMIDGSIPVDETYKSIVDAASKSYKQMLRDAVEAGVKGAKEALGRASSNYFPRIWKMREIRNVLTSIEGPDDRVNIINALAKTMSGKSTYKKAELLVSWIEKNKKKIDNTRSDNILDTLDDFIKDDADFAKMRELLASDGDKSSRLKERLEMDWSKFEPPKVTIGGVSKRVEIDDFVDRDVRGVTDSLANNMYGNIVLAKRDFPTTESLREAISNMPDDLSDELNSALDVLLNIPSRKNSILAHQLTELAKSYAFVVKMPYVAFSMTTELFKTVSNAGLGSIMQSVKHQIGRLDKNTEEFAILAGDNSGIGTASVRNRNDFRGADQMAANDSAVWGITKAGRKAQELVARGSGLVAGSDILQKANLIHHTKEFAKLVNGMDHKLIKTRLESYGINPDTIDMFAGDFTFNGSGKLNVVDKTNWSYDKRARYNDIMVRLGQEITPDVYLGTSGLWSHTTDIGKVLGFLLSYPLNLIENQAVKDAHFMDRRTVSNNLLTVAGAYVGLVAKYEALGRDYEHEDLYGYALMNIPSLALVTAMDSMTRPAILSALNDQKEAIKAVTTEI